MSNLAIQYVSPDRLRPYPGNARSHSRKQLKLIADSITRFGFTNPILVTGDFEVVAGHGRLQAAKSLGLELVPVVALNTLSGADKKALIIADNRIAELAGWDRGHSRDRIPGSSRPAIRRHRGHRLFAGRDRYDSGRSIREDPGRTGSRGPSSDSGCSAGFAKGRSLDPGLAPPALRGCPLRQRLRPIAGR